MQILINPINKNNALDLINKYSQNLSLFLGIENYSTRTYVFTIDEIKTIVEKKKNTKIYICLNKFFFEPEIDKLEKLILQLAKIKIDGIIFADFAIMQIIKENKIKIYTIYNPETMNANYGQLAFYENNKINEISLNRELSYEQIKEFSKNSRHINLQLQVAGYSYVMHSRWSLISNFCQAYKLKDKLVNKKLYIKEESRKEPMLIYEDNTGTSVFTSYNLCLLKQLDNLKKLNIYTIRIDTFLHDENWINQTIDIYFSVLNNNKCLKDKYQNILKLDNKISEGFFELNNQNLIYLPESIELKWHDEK